MWILNFGLVSPKIFRPGLYYPIIPSSIETPAICYRVNQKMVLGYDSQHCLLSNSCHFLLQTPYNILIPQIQDTSCSTTPVCLLLNHTAEAFLMRCMDMIPDGKDIYQCLPVVW